MSLQLWEPTDSTKRLVELIREFERVVRYIQNQNSKHHCMHIYSPMAEKEIYNSIKIINMFG